MYVGESLDWNIRLELLPTLFVMPGGDQIKWETPWRPGKKCKELLLALNYEFSLTVMSNRQAGHVPEPSTLRERRFLEKGLLETSSHA